MKKLTVCIFLIITICLLYNYNECLFGFCFGVAYISDVYFVHWIVTYFIRKKNIHELTVDLDKLFLDETFLLKVRNELQENSEKQLHTDQTKVF